MQLYAWSRAQIESQALPGPTALVCMADARDQLATVRDAGQVLARLDLIFNDASDGFGLVRPPTADDARKILDFVQAHANVPHLVLQCQVGVGRSQAALAALLQLHGGDPRPVLRGGTYNRKLHRLLLQAGGTEPAPEPLVSLAIRVKYAPDRLRLFILSMQRQRYENWELVSVTDGPNPQAAQLVAEINDPRVRLIQTPEPRGRWGHPHRQLAIDACRGTFIGLSNDDNYYVPGYLEQMVQALENADLALCQMLHSYGGWSVMEPGKDLGGWLARATLVRQVPWPGDDFSADRTFLEGLARLAGTRFAVIERPLFVHN